MNYLVIIIIIFSLMGCADRPVVKVKDLETFIQHEKQLDAIISLEEERMFWEKRLAEDPVSYLNMYELASRYLGLFRSRGDIDYLQKGDSLLQLSSARLAHSDPDLLQALAQASITKHKFRQAAAYNDLAKTKNASPFIYALIDFDASMELGSYSKSSSILQKIQDDQSFNFLIRQSKYLDHKGNLDAAIKLQEAAFNKIKSTNNSALYTWALSNLADMYGHAGRIKEAYNCYLQVLKKDPSYVYALKGIAWIAYAHDKNTELAKNLILFIKKFNHSPDYDLLLAEVAAYQGDEELEDHYTKRFIRTVEQPDYYGMYNTYLVELYCDQGKFKQAIALAENETNYRPTPETYSLLAWVHYKMGNINEALQISTMYVSGKSFEPDLILRTAYIQMAAGNKTLARKLLSELLESSFELGPLKGKEIKESMSRDEFQSKASEADG